MHVEARSGDVSAVAGASILASLSNLPKDLSLLFPRTKDGEDIQQNSELSTPPPDDRIPDIEMKDGALNGDMAVVSSGDKNPSPGTVNESPNVDSVGMDACVDAEVAKVPTSASEIRPLLEMLVGSSTELSGRLSRMLDERREIRELLKEIETPALLLSTRRQAFKETLQQAILSPDSIGVSFESFPYYLRCDCLL